MTRRSIRTPNGIVTARSVDEMAKKMLGQFLPIFKQGVIPLYGPESMLAMFYFGLKLGSNECRFESKRRASIRGTKRTIATSARRSSKIRRKKPSKPVCSGRT